MSQKPFILKILQLILAVLFASWLILLYSSPVRLAPDSYGYLADAKNLTEPGYVTIRPILYPAYLRLMGNPGPGLSVISFLLNSASLLYLLYNSKGKTFLFSGRKTMVLICYFLMTGIWSYCGTCLTESILFAVEVWIFALITKIIFPPGRQHILVTVLYSILVSVLAITLKPWIMLMVLAVSVLLFLASLFLHSFRAHRRSSFILLAVSVLIFILTLPYNRSKSAESANKVVLMISSGNEADLKERWRENKDLSLDSTGFIPSLLADIELINGKYKGNPWNASASNELKLLNILDKKQAPLIDKAFHLIYFEHVKNTLGLVFLAFRRYISELRLGLGCLDIAYGPELPGLRSFAIPAILIFSLLLIVYGVVRRDAVEKDLTIFTGIVLLAAVGFGLFLCLAGADELQRNVLPAVLFELFALTYIMAGKDPADHPRCIKTVHPLYQK